MRFGNGVVGNPLCPRCGSSLIPGGPRAAEPLLLKAPTSHLGVLQKKKKSIYKPSLWLMLPYSLHETLNMVPVSSNITAAF